ncbi:glycosyltransferase, partial [Candidatus Albibeggiatoa sp. nov. BB20]|uniref:glycosyltransferase n=1 Tax=Candidatus Albibeggiatoa sp. nov. BB20 TaxID=3162723 RepID=UPI0033658AEF
LKSSLLFQDEENKYILQNEASHLFYRFFFISVYFTFLIPNKKTFVKRLTDLFEKEQPDLVISVIPLLNNAIIAAVNTMNQSYPFLIIQTDLFQYEEKSWFWKWFVPATWFVKDKNTLMASGTKKGYQQALHYNLDKDKLMQLSGNVIDPRFLKPQAIDIQSEYKKLGLKKDRPTGLFLYGGCAPNRIFKLAQQLDRLNVEAQFIFICGRNEELKNRLSHLKTNYKKVVIGYSTEIPYYMQLADFLVGKPGPGVIMEGLALNLPLLLDVSRVILHEAENAPWLEQQGYGLQFNTAAQLNQQIQRLNSEHDRFKASVTRFRNNAIFEITNKIEQLLYNAKV